MTRERFSTHYLSAGDHAALKGEFRSEGVDPYLIRVVPPFVEQRRKEKVQKGADLYHKYVYRRVSSAMGKVIDRTRLPITELLFLSEIIDNRFTHSFLPNTVGTAINIISYSALASAGLYLPNLKRTPLSEKLGLEQKEFSVEEEMQYVVNQLNQRASSPHLDFDTLIPLAHDAITAYLEDKDGYSTKGTKKIKRALLTRQPLKKLGVLGVMNPIYGGEILTTSDKFDNLPAHEFAHSKGIPQEAQAQLAGVLSQIESGNPSLEYVGYAAWLNMLIRSQGFNPTISDEHNHISTLQGFGLNERTLQEIQDETQYLQKQKYGSKFGRKFTDIKLRAIGQKDAITAYSIKPLAFLADYRDKHST
jgi:hypothetical protein